MKLVTLSFSQCKCDSGGEGIKESEQVFAPKNKAEEGANMFILPLNER